MRPMPKGRFRFGQRVRSKGLQALTGIQFGAMGTIGRMNNHPADIKNGAKPRIHTDPLRSMIYVVWDSYRPQGVFWWELERVES